MLDKYLCRKIQKKEITIRDIINELGYKGNFIIVWFLLFLVDINYQISQLLGQESLMYKCEIVIISFIATAVITLIFVLILIIVSVVFWKIGSIKIAKCSLDKKE